MLKPKEFRLLFVCHGNICRSPMAEFVMKDLLAKAGRDDVFVASAAMRTDEIGSDTHYGTKGVLRKYGVPFTRRRARLLTRDELDDWDMIVGMDHANMRDLRRLAAGDEAMLSKMHMLLGFARRGDAEVADPWYTGDFETTYADVLCGCKALLERIPPP